MPEPKPDRPLLLAIIEYGGYPDFSPLYREMGFEVQVEYAMRKAMNAIKKRPPRLIVAEFNFQTDFRDRISNLETLMAGVQKLPGTHVIALHEPDLAHQFERISVRFEFLGSLNLPVDTSALRALLERARSA